MGSLSFGNPDGNKMSDRPFTPISESTPPELVLRTHIRSWLRCFQTLGLTGHPRRGGSVGGAGRRPVLLCPATHHGLAAGGCRSRKLDCQITTGIGLPFFVAGQMQCEQCRDVSMGWQAQDFFYTPAAAGITMWMFTSWTEFKG